VCAKRLFPVLIEILSRPIGKASIPSIDESRRPHYSSGKVNQGIEQKSLKARKRTGHGRRRLSWYLASEGGIHPLMQYAISPVVVVSKGKETKKDILSRTFGLRTGESFPFS